MSRIEIWEKSQKRRRISDLKHEAQSIFPLEFAKKLFDSSKKPIQQGREGLGDQLRHDKSLRSMTAAIVTHVYTTGPAQELEDYLKEKATALTFIGHPFQYAKDIRSFRKKYVNGQLTDSHFGGSWRFPEPLNYVKDFLLTLWWLLASKERIELFVGADSLNALAGIVLRRLGFINKVVFYSIDFVPTRFQWGPLNRLYHFTEVICLRHSDAVWNLSSQMITTRKRLGLLDDNCAPQEVVPIGVQFDRIKRRDLENIDRFRLVYMGHLREGQGLELIFESLPDILRTWPNSSLMVVGTGPLEPKLVSMAREMRLQSQVQFKGFVENHQALEDLLSHGGIGLALYEPTKDSFTWYTEPSKPKQYMACGLPVVITRVPMISQLVEVKEAGIVTDYNKASFLSALHSMFDDLDTYSTLRGNAIQLASQYDWNTIFAHALTKLDYAS